MWQILLQAYQRNTSAENPQRFSDLVNSTTMSCSITVHSGIPSAHTMT